MPTVQQFEDSSEDSFDSDISDDIELPQTPVGSARNGANAKSGKQKMVKKPPSPYHNKSASKQGRNKTPTQGRNSREAWLANLRAGGNGMTGAAKSSNYMGTANRSFKPGNFDSSSDYMKETVLGMPTKRKGRGNTMEGVTVSRNQKGVPSYKPQEDMYDDILDLKKQVNAISAENDRLKARNRRLEDEHIKKERQIEQLLDPSQGDLRLTLSSRQPDAAAKMSSLKQKNLKLEMALKEKEAEFTKLQGDLKSTKVEEMKVAMESFYTEVQRLRHQLSSTSPRSMSRSSKQGTLPLDQTVGPKIKALNGTILRLTETTQRLQSENKLLKTDLERALQAGDSTDDERNSKRSLRDRDYEDMNRKQLLKVIARLEEKVEKTEGTMKRSSQHKSSMPGKVELSGSLADRLDALDKRETELMEQNSHLNIEVTRLKEDKSKLRQKMEDLEDENKKLSKEMRQLEKEMRDERKRLHEEGIEQRKRSQDQEAKTGRPQSPGSESLRSHRSSRRASKASSQSSSRSKKKREEERWREEQTRKAEDLRLNNSAKSIQKNWRAHREKVKEDEEMDEAAKTIQSALRGHKNRKDQMEQFTPTTTEVVSSEEDESDVEYAARTIQSAVRGHWSRKDQLTRMSMTDSEPESVRSSRSRASSIRTDRSVSHQKQLGSEGDSEDDVVYTPKNSSRRGSDHSSRPSSAHSSAKRSASAHSTERQQSRNHGTPKSRYYDQQVETSRQASVTSKGSAKSSRYMFT